LEGLSFTDGCVIDRVCSCDEVLSLSSASSSGSAGVEEAQSVAIGEEGGGGEEGGRSTFQRCCGVRVLGGELEAGCPPIIGTEFFGSPILVVPVDTRRSHGLLGRMPSIKGSSDPGLLPSLNGEKFRTTAGVPASENKESSRSPLEMKGDVKAMPSELGSIFVAFFLGRGVSGSTIGFFFTVASSAGWSRSKV
jgi:hypothetical protein